MGEERSWEGRMGGGNRGRGDEEVRRWWTIKVEESRMV